MKSALPIATVVLALIAVWYVAAALMNAPLQRDQFANAGRAGLFGAGPRRRVAQHGAAEAARAASGGVANSTSSSSTPRRPRSAASSIMGAITLEETLIGFAIGSALGIGLAVLIVSMRWLDRSMMPWIVASQTVPIIALAPMIVVILNQFNITGVAPKAAIAAYLSFFPVTVGMVKGFRSPDPLQLDLMRTYSATNAQTFLKLSAPASTPFFFASMKVGAAAALVGAMVAEVTKSEDGGLGARLLAGSVLWADGADLGGAVRGRGAVGGAGRARSASPGAIAERRMAFTP